MILIKEMRMGLYEGDDVSFDVNNDGGDGKVNAAKSEKTQIQDNMCSDSVKFGEDDQNSSEVKKLARELLVNVERLISIFNNGKYEESDGEPADNPQINQLEQAGDNQYSPEVRDLLVQLLEHAQKFVSPSNERTSNAFGLADYNSHNQHVPNYGLEMSTAQVNDKICDSEYTTIRILPDCDQSPRKELEQSKTTLRNSSEVEGLLHELFANVLKLICPSNQHPPRSIDDDSFCLPDFNCDYPCGNDVLPKTENKKEITGPVLCQCCFNASKNKSKDLSKCSGIFAGDVRKPNHCIDTKSCCEATNNMEDSNKMHPTQKNMFKNILNQSKNERKSAFIKTNMDVQQSNFHQFCGEIKKNHSRNEIQCNGRRQKLDETLLEVLSKSTRKRQNIQNNQFRVEHCASTCGYNGRKQFNNLEGKKHILDDSFEGVKAMKNKINRGLLQATPKFLSSQNKTNSCKQGKNSGFPARITCVQPLGRRSLLVSWKIHSTAGLGGYKLYVDGCQKTRLFSSIHDSTCVFDVDIRQEHLIELHPIPKTDNTNDLKMNDKSLGSDRCLCFVQNSDSWTPSNFYYDPGCLPAGN